MGINRAEYGEVMKRISLGVLAVVLIGLFLCPVARASSFWTVKDAYKQRLSQVGETAVACEKGLKKYFPGKPGRLEIILYSSREAFVEGLQEELGFPQKFALEFKDHGAPRPISGKLLMPPDLALKSTCHEMVHHYMESFTNRDNLLGAKWFDEGAASFLSIKIMGDKRRWNGTGSEVIPLEKMTTEEQWGKLWSDSKLNRVAYMQAASMVEYFFEKYSIEQFRQILHQMNSKSFTEAFLGVTDIAPEEFYGMWLANKNNPGLK